MVSWAQKAWSELRTDELYALLALRQRVFVVEQRCAYLDCDGLDEGALHVLGWDEERLVAYARILARGVVAACAAFGRVVVAPEERGRGLGRALVVETIARAREAFPGPLHISAQAHLARFYGEVGFVSNDDLHEEDGIPHVTMRLPGEP